jgi:hypothetical protein
MITERMRNLAGLNESQTRLTEDDPLTTSFKVPFVQTAMALGYKLKTDNHIYTVMEKGELQLTFFKLSSSQKTFVIMGGDDDWSKNIKPPKGGVGTDWQKNEKTAVRLTKQAHKEIS